MATPRVSRASAIMVIKSLNTYDNEGRRVTREDYWSVAGLGGQAETSRLRGEGRLWRGRSDLGETGHV